MLVNKKTAIIVLSIVAVLLLGAIWVKNLANIRATDVQGSLLATAKVVRGSFELGVGGTASITANERLTLSARAAGVVDRVLVEEGSVVKAGDVLAVIDNPSYALSLERARLDALSQEHRLSVMTCVDAHDLACLETGLKAAETLLRARQEDAIGLTGKAPVSGRLYAVHKNLGEKVMPGQPVVSMVDDSVVYAEVMVAQSDIAYVQTGQRAGVSFGTEIPGATGTVDSVGVLAQQSLADGASFVPVRIRVENPDGVYRTGLATNVSIDSDIGDPYDVPRTVYASGKMVASATYDVCAAVEGVLGGIHASLNQFVHKDQPLFGLENDELLVLLEQAQNELESARRDKARAESGYAPGITEDDVIEQRLRLTQAELVVRAGEADLSELGVRAPLAGTVVSSFVKRGEYVAPGTPLFVLADFSSLSMLLAVDELDVAQISVGQQASVKVEATGGRYSATVNRVFPEGTAKDGVATYTVELAITDASDLKSGMSGTARIVVANREDVLLVPSEAVWFSGDSAIVNVMKDGRLESLEVSVGLMDSEFAEITSGLQEGDTVVLSSLTDTNIFAR